jgi:glycosyltransferase involved in cell wall biosynthesis
MTREIACHLGRAGARVTILPVSATLGRAYFPRPTLETEFEGRGFDEELARDSVRVRRVARHPLHWSLDARNVRQAVRQILDEEPVDAVLSYYAEAAFLPDLVQGRGIPFGFISTWQSYERALAVPLPGVAAFAREAVVRRLVVDPHRRADVLFATSRFTRQELIQFVGVTPGRIEICPLGVQNEFLEIPRAKPDSIARLLFFGRIIPSKGALDVIEAVRLLADRGLDAFRVRFRGQGDHAWARDAARERGVSDRIEVLGPADDDELRRELEEAQLAVMPSHFEAFGLVFAEAQAAGLPVVAYRAGSVPEVVEDGVSGWLAEARDVEGLADGIAEALGDPAEAYRRGLAGRDRVRRLFTWHNTAATILGKIKAILADGAAGRVRRR